METYQQSVSDFGPRATGFLQCNEFISAQYLTIVRFVVKIIISARKIRVECTSDRDACARDRIHRQKYHYNFSFLSTASLIIVGMVFEASLD